VGNASALSKLLRRSSVIPTAGPTGALVMLRAKPFPLPVSYRIAGKQKRESDPGLNVCPVDGLTLQLPVHQLLCMQDHQKLCALTFSETGHLKNYKQLRGG
jgi:hypothetical protein